MTYRIWTVAGLSAMTLFGPGCSSSKMTKSDDGPARADCADVANGIRFRPFAGKPDRTGSAGRTLPADCVVFLADSAEVAQFAARVAAAGDTAILAMPLPGGCEAFRVWKGKGAQRARPGDIAIRLEGRSIADTGATLRLTAQAGQLRGMVSRAGKSIMLSPAAGLNGERLLAVFERQRGAAMTPAGTAGQQMRQPLPNKATATPTLAR